MSPHGFHSRRGLTLIELLVTVSILLLLVVVAMPALTPSSESRRIREAARQLNVFFAAARAQAMLIGRPVGVWLERSPGLGQASVTLFQVEVPPAYSGETLSSTASLTYIGAANSSTLAVFNVTINGTLDTTKIAVGDDVQFNNQGPLYEVSSVNPLRVQLDIRDHKSYPWPSRGTSPPVPYKFFRQPVHSSVNPLELPAAVAIDLQSSGTDSYPILFRPTSGDTSSSTPTPIIIMFSPSASLDRVYYYSPDTPRESSRMIREPLYLLVGRRDRIQVPQNVTAGTLESQQPNWFSPESIWLTVSPLTGIVSAKENFRVPVSMGVRNAANLSFARTLARQAQTLGGR